ncbi:MAG: endolytic transglycosylase MltG [Clostridiales bacterium]|jgi:UPF0755 protein|nr:endolytic transglycosylase MltG [Clostridiales bacterium]
MADSATANRNKTTKPDKFNLHPVAKKILRQLLIFLISLALVLGSIALAVQTVYNKFIKPVDPEDDTLITVEVPMGTSINGIAEILYENNLIRNTAAFKLMVDLSNKSNKMQAGKYELSKSMTIQEIINELMTGQVSVSTVLVTIREGDDIRTIASRLVDEYNMNFTEEQFIAEARRVEKYMDDYPFLRNIPEERRESEFPMEGYLFPDTYYFYADSTPERIIRTMLGEFDAKFTQEMRDLADEQGMTMDEVVTLASIIQNEAKTEEFSKVSAVFHNRLKIGMNLESCATINYVIEDREVNQITLTIEDTKIDSQYNTYKNPGLPLGPISSPGLDALNAALNPYPEFMEPNEPMLFFVLMDPETGLHAFNSTYEGHVKDKQKYQVNWQ